MLIGPASAGPNPPGNNGTVKIDDVPFDDAPDNQPHVGCVFQVDFYGFDEGDLVADVTFESHPPTGPVQVLLTDEVFIGEDDNAGGGSQAGLDASATYTLDFTGIQPHPNQGFHVKLTVHADGSQGADTKHKVFWVTGCAPGATTTTTTRGGGSSGATSTTGTTTTTVADSQDTTTTAAAGRGSASSSPGGPAGVGASSATGSGGLPLTGAAAAPLLAAGLALLGLGAAALLRSRQRRT
jgi:LPXTG-motif cell wall-anchored protein